MEEEKKSKKRLSKVIYYVLLIFFSLVFICSAIYIGKYVWGSLEAGGEYGNLQDQYSAPTRPTITEATQSTQSTESTEMTEVTQPTEETVPPVTETVPPTEPTEPPEPVILEELQPFYEKNKHLVGWINLPDTKLNYPVLQSPENPDYYLNHTFEGTKSDWGAIYVRESCDVFKPSDNLTIYGHHMKDGSMFSPLDKFRQKSFWEENPYIYFDTLYERHTYQVIATFKIDTAAEGSLAYHLFEDFASEEEFNDYVSTIKELGRYYYYNDVPAQYGDKLITLSTCEYTFASGQGRLVVVAKRVA